MLSNYAASTIRDLVSSNLYNGKSFTSLDIANSAKELGTRVRNREVAEWLRSNVITMAYERGVLFNQTLIRVDSKVDGWTLAYLYHHMNTDADEYLDRDQNPKSYQITADKINDALDFAVAASQPVATAVQKTPAMVAASQIGLINRTIGLIVPDSFASRQAARDWVSQHSGYVVVDRSPYSVIRWGVKER